MTALNWLIVTAYVIGMLVVGLHSGRAMRNAEEYLLDWRHMRAANSSLKNLYDKLRTINGNNGREFAEHRRLTDRLGADVDFAKPYASYQCGLNENTNGLLRQFFPKGTDIAWISRR